MLFLLCELLGDLFVLPEIEKVRERDILKWIKTFLVPHVDQYVVFTCNSIIGHL